MAKQVPDRLRILIVEDSPEDVQLIERELSRGRLTFVSKVVENRHDFEEALTIFKPHVILSDHSLPEFNSFEALAVVLEFRNRSKIYLPFILVTGAVSEDFAIQFIRAGADDYILKDRLKRLVPSVLNALEKSEIEAERAKYIERLVANESMMREAERLARFGSWQVTLQSNTHRWSDEVYRIYGYAPGEVTPAHELILKHVVQEQRFDVINCFQKAIRELTSYNHEFSIVDNKGVLKYLKTKLTVDRDENGTPFQLTGFIHDVTDIKLSAIQLEKSEQEYKSLFEQNPDAVFSLDLSGKFTNANEALCTLTGLPKQSLLKMDFYPFLTKRQNKTILWNFVKASRGCSRQYEAAFINTHGKEFWLQITNIPIIVNGKIVGVHGIAKDITQQKHLGKLLRKVNDLARIGGWEIDFMTNKVRWTRITKELHEVEESFDPNLKAAIEFYIAGESRNTIRKVIDEAVTNGSPWDEELEIMTARGNKRWIRVIGEAETRNGQCLRLYGSVQDIHGRKQAETALRESFLEKLNILESIGDAFFAVDKNWIVTYWNNNAAETLKMPKENIIGKNLWDVYQDAVHLQFYKCYHLAVSENRSVHFEEYYQPIGIWVEVSAYPSPSGLSVYFRDITQRRIHAQAIAEQNKKLREIAWFQSHKVRGPLSRIMGLIELVKADDETKINNIIDILSDSAAELDSVINEIVKKTEEIDEKSW